MNLSNLGYTKPLYILPFDHRAVFAINMFGLESMNQLSEKQFQLIKEFKMLIYKGFENACEKMIPKEFAAVLCDEQFGSEVLINAKHNGFVTILTTEKSGEEEFKFQYENFQEHIDKFKPIFTKVLIKYNPSDLEDFKNRQKKNLKLLSDFSHRNGYKFLLEVLVLPTKEQLLASNSDRAEYDNKLRPGFTVEVIKDLQNLQIEPDVWKLEGFDSEENYREIIKTVKQDGRENVGLVILGRGAKEEKVQEWLRVGAKVDGVIGFAVGRTIFWDVIEKFYKGEIGKASVIEAIGKKFESLYKLYSYSSEVG